MGKRGPAPKSSVIRLLEGNPAKTRMKTAVRSGQGMPACPDHLDAYEREVWDRIVSSAPPALYGEIDSVILSAYCVAAGLHRTARLKIAVEGATQVGFGGTLLQSPWVQILQKQVQTISALGSKLGLDPAARMNLGHYEEKPTSRFGDLITMAALKK